MLKKHEAERFLIIFSLSITILQFENSGVLSLLRIGEI